MSKKTFVVLLVVGATALGMTVLREPLANAAQAVSTEIIKPLDANGNVKVHEQGTANVKVTNLRSEPVQVSVTNTSVPVEQAGEPVTIKTTGFGLGTQYTVPENKLLVLQYVNALTDDGSNNPAPVNLNIDEPGGGEAPERAYHFAGETFLVSHTFITRSISEPLTIYVEAGSTLQGTNALYSGYLLND